VERSGSQTTSENKFVWSRLNKSIITRIGTTLPLPPRTTVYTLPHTYDGFFNAFSPTTVHTSPLTHDGLGRAALVRRFKNLKPSHKEIV
jgi:hypothetical protein